MKYNPKIHHRKSIRLKGYDYSQAGLYFITICTQNRENLFGKIVGADLCVCPEMILNDAGKMVKNEWLRLPQRFNSIILHEYVLMPNHFHGIIEIITVRAPLVGAQNVGAQLEKGQPQGIAPTGKHVGGMVGAFKSITTNEYIRGVKNNNWQRFNGKLWQRNYWEHIVRNENEYQQISEYMINNPIKWDTDKLNDGDGNRVMEPQSQYAYWGDRRGDPCGRPNDEVWKI